MAPLAIRGLVSAGVTPPPELKALSQANTLGTLGSIVETKRLLNALQHINIEAIVLKGPVLSQLLFDNPTLRQSKDIDLLVTWEDFERAIECLEVEGYHLRQGRPPFGSPRVDIWRRGAKDVTMMHARLGHLIELHHRLLLPDTFIPTLGVGDAVDSATIGELQFRTFRAPDLFAYLAAHGTSSLWHRLKWLADIRAMLAESSAQELTEFLDGCRIHGVERSGALAMLLCHRLWGQQLPARMPALLAENNWLKILEKQSLHMMLAVDVRLPFAGRMKQLSAGFVLRDGGAFKCSVVATHVYHQSLVSRLPLPRVLRFLYGPARLLDWLAKRIWAALSGSRSRP